MIAFRVQVTGSAELARKLGSAPAQLLEVAKSTLDAWAKATAAYCISEKLSGNPIRRITGRLSRTVHGQVAAAGTSVSGVVAAGADVPYARPLEFGAKAHVVVATNAMALRIPLPDGTVIFRKSANIPAMPGFEYMRGSLRDRAPAGIAQLKAASLGIFR